jgi:hypothetical protein
MNTELSLACFYCAMDHATLRHLVYDSKRDLVICPVHGVIFTCEQMYNALYKVTNQ